ncbi:PAS domain S-box protein [bacterium]|nr:PAS domain S-box protein [bacterium]
MLLIDQKGSADSPLRSLLQEITDMGLRIEAASSHPSVLGAIAQRDWDVCLVDCRVGEWPCQEVMDFLHGRGGRLPVVFWATSRDSSWAAESARRLPGVDFLQAESTSTDLLRRAIQQAVLRKRSEASLRHFAGMQQVVAELGQTALASEDLSALMDACLKGVAQALKVEYAKVLELLPGDLEFVLRAGLGWHEQCCPGETRVSADIASQAGYTLVAGSPVVVDDLAQEVRFEGPVLLREHEVVSGISVSIPGMARAYGVLGAHSRQRRSFCMDEVNFLVAVANILAQSVIRFRWRHSLNVVNQLLLLLSECDQMLLRTDSEADFLAGLCRAIVTTGGYAMAWVGCVEASGELRVVATAQAGSLSQEWPGEEVRRRQIEMAVATGEMQTDTQYDLRACYCSYVSLPLRAAGRTLGVVSVVSARSLPVEGQELSLLGRLADNLAFALQALRARAEARRTAEQQNRLASILESSAEAIIGIDLDFTITDWNLGAQQICGYSRQEAVGQSCNILVPEGSKCDSTSVLEQICRGQRVDHFELIWITKQRKQLDVWLTITPLRNPDGTVVGAFLIASDITNRKQIERDLTESQAQLASIIETAMHAIVSVDEEQRVLLFNRAAEEMFRCPASQALGRPLDRLLPERFRQSHGAHLLAFGQGAQSMKYMGDRLEVSGLRADGEEFPMEASISQLDVNGKKLYTAIIRDVTRRKRAQEKLARSEAQFRSLFENALDAVLIADDQGRFVDANPAACALLGGSRQQVVGSLLYDYMRPDRRESVAEIWREFLDTGSKRGLVRIFRLDGASLVVDFSSTAHFSPGLNLSVLRDVSRQRQLEDQLRQSQKMEAVGQLAGGVAHDFNNLLMVILGYADDARQQMGVEDPTRQCLEEIHLAAGRAVALTGQLLAFSRKQIVQPRVLDLNHIVIEIQKMLERLIREDIHLRALYSSSPLFVSVDPGQIQQLVVNLVVNARDAMPQGGHLQLETQELTLDGEYASRHLGVQPGRYAMLAVSDTGVGMCKDTQKRIFEPFFTTKGVGQGTGLGLSTAFGIAAQAGGSIWVYSEIGVGSVFKVYLPAVEQGGERVGEAAPTMAPAGTETILLVEDDESLRRLIARVFAGSGYTLLVAGDGERALQLARQSPQPIDLLLTDVVMPGLPGREVAEGMRAIWPQAKVLFMSGYTADSVVRQEILGGDVNFIQKPFSPGDLKRKVRSLLDPPGLAPE